jgi:hypothetical protein
MKKNREDPVRAIKKDRSKRNKNNRQNETKI